MDTDVREQLQAAGLDAELLAAVERGLDEPFEYSATVYLAGAPAVTHELDTKLEARLRTLGQLGRAEPFAGVVLREPDAVVIGSAGTQAGPVEVLELFDGELVAGRGSEPQWSRPWSAALSHHRTATYAGSCSRTRFAPRASRFLPSHRRYGRPSTTVR